MLHQWTPRVAGWFVASVAAATLSAQRGVANVKLVASDGSAGDQAGLGVSINGDTALVGAYADDPGGTDSGSAYVYRNVAGAWIEEAKLVPSDAQAGDNFGLRVSLSGDIAVVGSPNDDDGGVDSGSAYVFHRTGSTWTQEAKLFAIEPRAGDQFGRWMIVDGQRVVLSCHLDDYAGLTDAGSLYVFRRSSPGTWVREGWLRAPSPGDSSWFARSVGLRGTTLVVGEPRDDTQGADAGRAHVFEYVGGSWMHRAELFAPDGAAGDQFGGSCTANASRVAIGAIRDDHAGGIDAGSAYVFLRSRTTPWALPLPPPPSTPTLLGFRNSTWDFEQKLVAFDAATGDQFARSLSLSGSVLVATAIFDDHAGGADAGSAYAFERTGQWNSLGKFVPEDSAAGDLLGYTVAVDGRSACVGVYLDDNPRGVDAGSAYVVDVDALDSGVD